MKEDGRAWRKMEEHAGEWWWMENDGKLLE